jgi:hypothetical protein
LLTVKFPGFPVFLHSTKVIDSHIQSVRFCWCRRGRPKSDCAGRFSTKLLASIHLRRQARYRLGLRIWGMVNMPMNCWKDRTWRMWVHWPSPALGSN